MQTMGHLFGTAAIALAALATSPASAQDFYAEKTIRLIVGSAAGGPADAYARLVARHLGEHLPGRPTLIVSNMPGASGVTAANYVFGVAPKDGTVIGTFTKSLPSFQAVGQPGVRFKAEEFGWLGCLNQAVDTLAVWHTTGIATIDDAKSRPLVMGAISRIGTMWTYPALLNAYIGTKFKIVTGYESGTAVNFAMERGEVEGRGSNPWVSWKALHPDWVKDKKIVPLVQVGLQRHPDLPDVPLMVELAQNEEQRQLFKFVSDSESIDRPYAAPPGVSPEILAILRKGFAAMIRDPAFLADAAGLALELDPLPGDQVTELVTRVVKAPPDVVQKLKALLDAPEQKKQ